MPIRATTSTSQTSSTGGASAGPAPAPAPAPSTTSTPSIDNFEKGLSTSQKKSAERALGRAGLFNGGKIDGTLTDNSRKAIRRFQRANGLDATGTLDRTTYRKLIDLSKLIQRKGTTTVRPGMASARVKNIEKRLKLLGYDVGAADGLFTERTAAAVRAFKADQGIRDSSGALGVAGQRELRAEEKGVSHAPYRNRVKNTKAHRQAEANVTTLSKKIYADGTEGMRKGPGKKASVKHLQRHLLAAGFDPKSTDGVFDTRTEGMLKLFQKKSGLPPHGRLDSATWQKLRKVRMESSNAVMSTGERSSAVKYVEQKLKRLGFNPGKVDGLYDRNTQRAIDRFRREFKVGGSGGLGPNALKRLKQASTLPKGQKVQGYVRGTPRTLEVVQVDGVQMEVTTAKAWKKMKAAAKKAGITLGVNSGFRTMAKQRELYARYLNGGNLAAKPGYSNHQSGAAVDIAVGVSASNPAVGTGAAYNWLSKNASKFGFKRIAGEAWHWEYQPLIRKYS